MMSNKTKVQQSLITKAVKKDFVISGKKMTSVQKEKIKVNGKIRGKSIIKTIIETLALSGMGV